MKKVVFNHERYRGITLRKFTHYTAELRRKRMLRSACLCSDRLESMDGYVMHNKSDLSNAVKNAINRYAEQRIDGFGFDICYWLPIASETHVFTKRPSEISRLYKLHKKRPISTNEQFLELIR